MHILVKISILLFLLALFMLIGSRIFKKSHDNYNPLVWGIIEFCWYMTSFVAVCVGLVELDRIEKLDTFKENEKLLILDYNNNKNLLYAQAWLLKIDSNITGNKAEGIKWFHKMKALFEEGMYSSRWEGFLFFSRSYVLREPGLPTNFQSKAMEYNWPQNLRLKPEDIFLKDEIKWMVDSLSHFKQRKDNVLKMMPEENTNYVVRYVFIFIFLAGLSLKLLKIRADYHRAKKSMGP